MVRKDREFLSPQAFLLESDGKAIVRSRMAPKQHIKVLDWIRAFAASWVMLYHLAFRGQFGGFTKFSYPPVASFAKYGWLSVPLFFMLSGFVVLMSAENRAPRQFARARFLRLYPAFWICCLLTFVIVSLCGSTLLRVSRTAFLVNLTMLPEIFHRPMVDFAYWSLYQEFKFYFLLFVILWAKQMKQYERILWGWLVLATILTIYPYERADHLLPLPESKWAGYFIAGGVCYLAYRERWNLSKVGLMLGSLLISFVSVQRDGRMVSKALDWTPFSPYFMLSCVAIFYAVFVAISLKWDVKRGAAYLAALTYPIYLLHEFVGWVLLNRLPDFDPLLKLMLVTTLICALAVGVHEIEKKFGGWLKAKIPA